MSTLEERLIRMEQLVAEMGVRVASLEQQMAYEHKKVHHLKKRLHTMLMDIAFDVSEQIHTLEDKDKSNG